MRCLKLLRATAEEKKRPMVGYTRSAGLGCVLLCLLMSGGCQQQEPRRRSQVFLIPAGYAGWVEVEFGVPNAPPLPIENDSFVLRIHPSGRLQTSTPIEYGWAKDEIYSGPDGQRHPLRLTGPGEGGMVWEGYNGEKQGRRTSGFFVGTEAQWRSSKIRWPGNLNGNAKGSSAASSPK
jgi:hypothetical protein